MRKGVFRFTLVAVVTATLLSSASPVVAYVSRGRDPAEGLGADVITSRRRVWVRHDGHRYVEVRIGLSPEEQSLYFFKIRVRLDTRGDGSPDAAMYLVAGDAASGAGNPSCMVTALGRRHEGRLLGIGSKTGCRARAAWLHPTKKIRWKIRGEQYYQYDPPAGADLAPDVGWYA